MLYQSAKREFILRLNLESGRGGVKGYFGEGGGQGQRAFAVNKLFTESFDHFQGTRLIRSVNSIEVYFLDRRPGYRDN